MPSKSGGACRRAGSATTPAFPTTRWKKPRAFNGHIPEKPTHLPVRTRRLYTDGLFQTADGRAQLICADWEPFPEQPSSSFPLVFNTGRTVEHWHTRTKTGAVPILEQMSPRAWLEMNPVDAKRLMLRPHDLVDIISTRGRVRRVELRVTEVIGAGAGICAISLCRVEYQ